MAKGSRFVGPALQVGSMVPGPQQPFVQGASALWNIAAGGRAEDAARRAQAEQQSRAREALSQALAESTAKLRLVQSAKDAGSEAATAATEAGIGADRDEAKKRLAMELSRKNVSTLNPYASSRISGLEKAMSSEAGKVRGAGYAQKLGNAASAATSEADIRARLGQAQSNLEAGFPQFDVDQAPDAIKGYSEAAARGLETLSRSGVFNRRPAGGSPQARPNYQIQTGLASTLPGQARQVQTSRPTTTPSFVRPDFRGSTGASRFPFPQQEGLRLRGR